ncbi:MAG: effector binding domain-containing protein [Cellulosilyticaceae bacterium]
MEMMTVSEVSRNFDVSTRMLRYYEKVGLISSCRKEDYAYRIYDESAVRRLQLIIVMRKLRIPLKQIAVILDNDDCSRILEVLHKNIAELDVEMNALGTIRSILQAFAKKLDTSIQLKTHFDLLDEKELISLSNALHLSKHKLKEEHLMSDLNTANESLGKNINVRMVLLPPCTVASYHYVGENPEEIVGEVMNKFIRESKLYEIKPDARLFGFNHPNPSQFREHYGYEDWVTIPDNMDVPEPLVKKKFKGGLYAAHTIEFPNFQEWGLLTNWVMENDTYCANYSELGEEVMDGCLEEHLNWVYSSHMGWPEKGIDGKIDLLFPIKSKQI